MKKRAALLVALSLAVVTVLAGCGGKDSSKSADSKDSAATFEEKKEGDTFFFRISYCFAMRCNLLSIYQLITLPR